jgi:NitT/TauT family transport system substrate-binding protein
MQTTQSRRRFLTTLSLAGAASLLRVPRSLAAEGALETTTVRFPKPPVICIAPQYVAEELLRAEGFTDIRYIEASQPGTSEAVARDEIDFDLATPWALATGIDAGQPITLLAGVHVGCYELFGS